MMGLNKFGVGIIPFVFQTAVRRYSLYFLQSKMAKFKSPNLGMETLLNAPLHASQQRDKVSSILLYFVVTFVTYHPHNL